MTMQVDTDAAAQFQFVFESPTDDHIRRLTPPEYEQFIGYLFERDALYHPVLVGGTGDGGVDIELYARDGVNSQLCGLVQCKRYLLENVSPAHIAPLIVAANNAHVPRRYVFTTSGFTPAARKDARNNDVHLFDCADVRFWIQDIRRRQTIKLDPPALTEPETMPIPLLCISNNKGGVGKTTITGNLAAALATDQHGVLVIDADPQAHLTYWLTNQKRIPPPLSLYAVLANEVPIRPLVQKTLEKGIWLLPACSELNDLPNGHHVWALERRLSNALLSLPLADPPIRYILLDTPPALNSLTRAALLAATSLIIPLQLDLFSLEGLDELLKFIEHTEAAHQKKPLSIVGGVASMVDQRFRWGFRFWEQPKLEMDKRPRLLASGLTPDSFWCAKIRHRVDFKKAQGEHRSVLTFAPHSDAATDISQLAQEVTHRVPVLVSNGG
jgi:chromosome partitioning protein